MVIPVTAKTELDLSDDEFSFKLSIEKLRDEVKGMRKEKWGIGWLTEGGTEDHFDIKIWIDKGAGRLIVARIRLSDLYLIGFRKGNTQNLVCIGE